MSNKSRRMKTGKAEGNVTPLKGISQDQAPCHSVGVSIHDKPASGLGGQAKFSSIANSNNLESQQGVNVKN